MPVLLTLIDLKRLLDIQEWNYFRKLLDNRRGCGAEPCNESPICRGQLGELSRIRKAKPRTSRNHDLLELPTER